MKYGIIVFLFLFIIIGCNTHISNRSNYIIKTMMECNINDTKFRNEVFETFFIVSKSMENSIINIKQAKVNEPFKIDSMKYFGYYAIKWNDNQIDTFFIYQSSKTIKKISDFTIIYKNCLINDNSSIIRAFFYSLPLFISEKYINMFFPNNEYDYLNE